MGVADYSKRQLKTIRFPISRAPIWTASKWLYAHVLQHTSYTALLHYAGYCHR